VARLEEMGWLRRNDSNYLILGVRAYLELRTTFANMLRDAMELEEGDRGGGDREKMAAMQVVLDEMPQQIIY
jgi:hypothetical protein